MVAVERAGGFVRPIIAPAKLVATGFTLGGGGAAGREGPIVLIAASLASTIGRLTRQPSDMLVLMVAAAAAGGSRPRSTRRSQARSLRWKWCCGGSTCATSRLWSYRCGRRQHRRRGVLRRLRRPRPAADFDINSSWELFLHAIVGISAAIAGILFVRTRFLHRGRV